eukprot:NODE_17_length_48642_cov_1.199349.p15 type:complete len:346 gc:universal NODE_17_length_48642_cov_1.199349:31151-32188(+)
MAPFLYLIVIASNVSSVYYDYSATAIIDDIIASQTSNSSLNPESLKYSTASTSTISKVFVDLSPPTIPDNPSLMDQLEANQTCSLTRVDLNRCLTDKISLFINTRFEWYFMLVLNICLLILGMVLFAKIKLKELVMKKSKKRTAGAWAKVSFIFILPISLFNLLILLTPKFPAACAYLPSIMGFALICLSALHLMSLIRIIVRLVVIRPQLVSTSMKATPGNPDEDYVERAPEKSKGALLIDILCQVGVIAAILVDFAISGSLLATNPMTIGQLRSSNGISDLLTCRPAYQDEFVKSFFIPKILVFTAIVAISVFLTNNPQYFASAKLDDVPEGKEDTALALKSM